MKVKQLFNNPSDITIEDYISKHGVDDVEKYLKPTKDCIEKLEHYDGMFRGWDTIVTAMKQSRTSTEQHQDIYLIQDSDVDGLCSASIIYQYLKQLNPNININVLFHTKKTHGITDEILEQVADGCLIIIPDASVNSKKYQDIIESRNISVVQTDHHDIKIDNGKTIVCINNQFGDVENKSLSGAGVTHKFCQYIDSQVGKKFASQYVDLVALSIVSDSCSMLTYENRAYLAVGLNKINNPCYKYLCENFIKKDTISPIDLSFNVINVLNAVQRSDNQALKERVFRCFVGEDDSYKSLLTACRKEKRLQDDDVKEAIEMADIVETDKLVIATTQDATALSGLLANKLMSKYQRPVFVVHEDENVQGKILGSCRSPVPIREQIADSGLCIYAAGHPPAFGVAYFSSNTDNLIDYCNQLDLEDTSEYNVIFSIDSRNLSKIPDKLYDFTEENYQLFGNDLPSPKIHVKGIKTKGEYIYEMGNGSTIKLLLGDVTAIKFFCSKEYRESIHVGEKIPLDIELVGTLQWNEWNGEKYKQIKVEQLDVKVGNDKLTIDDLW